MKLNSAFIRLPFEFDVERMALELAQFSNIQWMSHPDKIDGNSALPLISSGGGRNNEFKGEMKPTPLLDCSHYLQQVIASFGEVFGRSRLMRLDAGCEVSPHVDFNHHWHHHVRIHIPIVTSPNVIFYCGDKHVHMPAGTCWIFDSWRLHRVVNRGEQARVHLVIDTAGSSHFWEMVEQAELTMKLAAPSPVRFIPYVPNQPVELRTERFNLQPVMSPGDVDGLTRDLITDFESEPSNDKHDVVRYRKHLLGFCQDWRTLWYLHGMHESGWPDYKELIDATMDTLPDIGRPLLMLGGNCQVKAALMARILGVALSPETYTEFISVANPRPPAPYSEVAEAASGPESGAQQQTKHNVAVHSELGRNARCGCGSGLRYKHCHGVSASPG